MANLIWDADHPELALLIEDSWQNRRLGTILARRLADVARDNRFAVGDAVDF